MSEVLFKHLKIKDSVIVQLLAPPTAVLPRLDMSYDATHQNTADTVAELVTLSSVDQQYTRPTIAVAIALKYLQ